MGWLEKRFWLGCTKKVIYRQQIRVDPLGASDLVHPEVMHAPAYPAESHKILPNYSEQGFRALLFLGPSVR
jgi:hypothetical protein